MKSVIAALQAILGQIINTETNDDYLVEQLSLAASAIMTAITVLEDLES
jgi:hypothetical protein